MTDLIQKTADFAKATLENEGSGHDWWHVWKVWQNSINIAAGELKTNPDIDLEMIELTALLHDIADWKNTGDEKSGGRVAKQWLLQNQYSTEKAEQIANIIDEMSFKGANTKSQTLSLEGQIVQDADRLEAIGAMGIARTFTYGGSKGREIYNPNIPSTSHSTFEQYRNSKSHTLNHFYEKLLLLKDRFNTQTAKVVAKKRHEFMELFLKQFYTEWNNQDFEK